MPIYKAYLDATVELDGIAAASEEEAREKAINMLENYKQLAQDLLDSVDVIVEKQEKDE